MNRFGASLTAAILSAVLLIPATAHAMDIVQFDRMADTDQKAYLAHLIQGAQKALTDAGKADQASRINKLFAEDQTGMTELMKNLAILRSDDVKNRADSPKDVRLTVEDAVSVTTRKAGIELPASFFGVGGSFRPKFPLKQ
jgi:hypothetical protein